jgi:hypothetical protein
MPNAQGIQFSRTPGHGGAWVIGPGDKYQAARMSESNWANELVGILAAADPDEFDSVRGKAMANLFGKKSRSQGIYNSVVFPSDFPEPTYVVIREGKTTAKVINTLTGMAVTAAISIQKACKKAKQLNGDTE